MYVFLPSPFIWGDGLK